MKNLREIQHQNTIIIIIDSATFNWFLVKRKRNVPITGELIKEKAKEYAISQGINDFKASNGWIARFKERHLISFRWCC